MNKGLKIHPADNVIVALKDMLDGELITVDGTAYPVTKPVRAKHKFVTHDLAVGDPVVMYGVLVGKATKPILKGEPITTGNVRHDAGAYSAAARSETSWTPPDISQWEEKTFLGYYRGDGSVGTANYWLVIPLVFCENRNILKLKEAFEKALGFAIPDTYQRQVSELVQLYKEGRHEDLKKYTVEEENVYTRTENQLFPRVDGIKFLTHDLGCGCTNPDADVLSALFAAYALHPNVAGVTVLSLGCQKTRFSDMMERIQEQNPAFDKKILFFEQQAYGKEFLMLSAAIRETFNALVEVNKLERKPAPLSKLKIGLKCGGSDGFSGISANPVLGALSDKLVQLGATTLLAEFPELCGVEQELINRCVTEEKAVKFETLMRQYAAKAEAVGASFDMNPSVGNIKDGLITDAIKSAGAAKKGGTSPVTDVLNYAEPATRSGLNLVCTPGNDVLATTGLSAAGATIQLFTTGLGTPTGNPVCPVVKIATNSELARKMPDIIDFDCGKIITGEQSIDACADELLQYCIRLASGEIKTKAQLLGQDDFIPWQQGVSL